MIGGVLAGRGRRSGDRASGDNASCGISYKNLQVVEFLIKITSLSHMPDSRELLSGVCEGDPGKHK